MLWSSMTHPLTTPRDSSTPMSNSYCTSTSREAYYCISMSIIMSSNAEPCLISGKPHSPTASHTKSTWLSTGMICSWAGRYLNYLIASFKHIIVGLSTAILYPLSAMSVSLDHSKIMSYNPMAIESSRLWLPTSEHFTPSSSGISNRKT